MIDHRKALADIDDIRSQMAASITFRGLGPAALTATGAAALLTAVLQDIVLTAPQTDPLPFLLWWIAVAVFCAAVIGCEMVVRSRRHHSGLADAMIYNAIQQFLPAGAAGAAIAAILYQFAGQALWILPGLWQILVGIGIFSAARSLPKGTSLVGAWYFVAGCAVLMMAAQSLALSPWTMGLPFGIGQCLLALVIHRSLGDLDVE